MPAEVPAEVPSELAADPPQHRHVLLHASYFFSSIGILSASSLTDNP